MKRAFLPLTACLLASLPAAAQETRWAMLGKTEILRDATGCTARTVQPSGVVEDVRLDTGGIQSLILSHPGWSHADGTDYPVKMVRYVGKFDRVGSKPVARGFHAGDRRGVRVPLGKTTAPEWLQAPMGTVEVHGSDPKFSVTAEVWRSNRALSRCASELSRIDRGSGKPAVTPPTATLPWSSVIRDEDYPSPALRIEGTGRTSLLIIISAKGLVSGCTVTSPSGNATLDSASCTFISLRLRMTPPLDADGKPTEAQITQSVRWQIPG